MNIHTNSISPLQTQVLQQALIERLPNAPWQMIVETCAITGVADVRQLHQTIDLSRKKFRHILQVFTDVSVGLPPILRPLDIAIPRSTTRGRPPQVYLLDESGAAILRQLDLPNSRPSGLTDPHAIAHALAMLDIHLTACQSGKDVRTDKPLSFGENRTLRVDHQIQLSNESIIFYEVEQLAVPKFLRRIRKSLVNRWDFFVSPAAAKVCPQVRILFNLRRGRKYEITSQIWEQALGMLQMERGLDTPFVLLSLPIPEFLEQPEWDVVPSERWDTLQPISPATQSKNNHPAVQQLPQLDPGCLEDDRRYLESLRCELSTARLEDALTAGQLSFFQILDIIYQEALTSTDSEYILSRRPPLTAIALLHAHLERHADLQARLKNLMQTRNRRTLWREFDIFKHMQKIIDVFVAYHGWHNRLMLSVSAKSVSSGDDPMFPFAVHAQMPMYMSRYLQTQSIQLQTDPSEALAWALWALFAYGKQLGLGQPAYW